VFVRGTDGACWYKNWTGTAWSSWKSLGGQLAPNTGPGVMGLDLNTTTRGYEVFVQGTDGQLWWQQFGLAGSRALHGATSPRVQRYCPHPHQPSPSATVVTPRCGSAPLAGT
jgi:hypothetical protein